MAEKQEKTDQLQDLTRKQLLELEREQKTRAQRWLDLVVWLLPLLCGAVGCWSISCSPITARTATPWCIWCFWRC